jgi:hypothetical protein
MRRMGLTGIIVALAWGLIVSAAWGADQFTIDRHPDSFGAVVTDAAGNGYVAWEHLRTGGAADTPMFCRLAAGAKQCADPIALSLPGGGGLSGGGPLSGDELSANQVFPILGPGSTVWVVTSRYVADDTVIWTSTDGGRTFGAPHEIPYYPTCDTTPCKLPALSVSYSGLTDVDDMLPVRLDYATYDRQVESSPASVAWLESSNNPGLGFDLDDTGELYGGPAGATEFAFDNTGGGGVGGSALGTTSVGEAVEAYWLDSTPVKLAYYYFHEPPSPVPISPQDGWSGPVIVGTGYLPRLAEGAAGLFMISEDAGAGHAAQPNLVQIRKYSTATHTFGASHTLASDGAGEAANLFLGGGLAENEDTGQLAAAWPDFTDSGTSVMRLWLSTDGGSRFSAAQDVATAGFAYADSDNARVAIADDGTGFVTFQDAHGLEVANLEPLAAQYARLKLAHPSVLELPVTCQAPKVACKATASITVGTTTIATGQRLVLAGETSTLRLVLDASGQALLAAAHHHLKATLELTITHHGAPPDALTIHTVIVR